MSMKGESVGTMGLKSAASSVEHRVHVLRLPSDTPPWMSLCTVATTRATTHQAHNTDAHRWVVDTATVSGGCTGSESGNGSISAKKKKKTTTADKLRAQHSTNTNHGSLILSGTASFSGGIYIPARLYFAPYDMSS